MKLVRYALGLLVIVLCATFTMLGSVAAQDEHSDPPPTDTGTPGLVGVVNNLNLPAVPPSPNATAPDSAPRAEAPPILPTTQTAPITNNPFAWLKETDMISRSVVRLVAVTPAASLDYDYVYNHDKKWLALIDHSGSSYPVQAMYVMTETWLTRRADSTKLLHRQSSDVVYSYTNPTNGVTVNVFSDSTFVAEEEDGATLMTGYFSLVAPDTVVAIGEDSNGARYAFHDTYFSAYTADGDVVIGNFFTAYIYDYDPDGRLLSLTDSDGGAYQVQAEDSGFVSITGPDGYSVLAEDTGAFELYNEADDLVVAGDLYDAAYDEFSLFEANADDNSDTTSDNRDNTDSSGAAGSGDTDSESNSGGDSGSGDDGGG